MRTIAIVLGDNDFGKTFQSLLEGLKIVLEYHDNQLSSDAIRLIIRHSVMAYYISYQHHFTTDLVKQDNHLNHIREYLVPLKILFDEEAEADISSKDHDGGAWYLEIQSGIVASY